MCHGLALPFPTLRGADEVESRSGTLQHKTMVDRPSLRVYAEGHEPRVSGFLMAGWGGRKSTIFSADSVSRYNDQAWEHLSPNILTCLKVECLCYH